MDAPQVPLTQLAPTVIGVMWMETLIAGIFVWLRVWARYSIAQAGVGWDDAFMVITWFLFVAYSASCTAAALWGFGHHMDDLSIPQFSKANFLEVIGQTCLITAIATSKTSVALFLLRIVVKVWHQVVLWTAIVTLAIICFLCASLNFLQCKPVAHLWNPTIEAECWMSVTPLAIATGAYSVFIDFLLAGLPWAIVWGLNMKRKEKLNIAISLSLGVFAGMCGIIRTYELQGLSAHSDYTYVTVSLVIWSASELLITIICANIPMLRPLWSRLRNKGSSADRPSDSHELENPTIGSARQHRAGKSKDLHRWSALDDADMDTMASQLGGSKQGKSRTVVKGRFVDVDGNDDDARSDESILRDTQRRGSVDGGGGLAIEVHKEYEVRNTKSVAPGQAW